MALAARKRKEVDALAERNERIVAHVVDVTREEDCRAVVDAALARFGRLDILVNNAGRGMKYVSESFMTEPTRFWEVNPETWWLVIDTNVNGPFLMARAAVPHLLAAGWGRVINVSASHEPCEGAASPLMAARKAALESETIIWAEDLAGSGVTVNALLPGGATLTGMIPQTFPAERRAGLLQPELMVPPLLYLCSEEADGVTGIRFNARLWRTDLPLAEAALAARENAGWPGS